MVYPRKLGGIGDVWRDCFAGLVALAGYVAGAVMPVSTNLSLVSRDICRRCHFAWVCGGKPAEGIYVVLSKIGTAWYFLHFLVLTPIVGWIERPGKLPDSIADDVLQGRPMQTAPAE